MADHVLPVLRAASATRPTAIRRRIRAVPRRPPVDQPAESDIGLRTFDELNATLSQITGVPQTNARVAATYALVKQALPAVEKFGTFGPAQQTGLAQLAIQYCSQMVDTPNLRTAFFGGALEPGQPGQRPSAASGSRNARTRPDRRPAHQGQEHRSASGIRMTTVIHDELDDLITS